MNTQVFSINIENESKNNMNFRKVLHTTDHQQLVVMSLKPNENISREKHTGDQFIRIEEGEAKAIINDTQQIPLPKNSIIMIPANTYHEIINTSSTEHTKLYTIYSPPQHPKNQIDVNKPEESQEGGNFNYHQKYAKYKQKYNMLKKSTNYEKY